MFSYPNAVSSRMPLLGDILRCEFVLQAELSIASRKGGTIVPPRFPNG